MIDLTDEIRSFIAVDIPEGIVASLRPIRYDLSSLAPNLRMVDEENLHFTLKFLGNIGREMIGTIGGCMKSTRSLLGFDIKVRGLGAFPSAGRARVVWAGVSEGREKMIKLTEALDSTLSGLKFKKEKGNIPHLTVARAGRGSRRPDLSKFIEATREREIGNMHVDSIKLKRSKLTPQGPIYNDILEVQAGDSN